MTRDDHPRYDRPGPGDAIRCPGCDTLRVLGEELEVLHEHTQELRLRCLELPGGGCGTTWTHSTVKVLPEEDLPEETTGVVLEDDDEGGG